MNTPRPKGRSFFSPRTAVLLLPSGQSHIHHLADLPLLAVAGHDHCTQARIVEGHSGSRRAVQEMQGHAIAPDGGAALHYDERAARNLRQRRERLGGGDGRGDADGIYFHLQALASWIGSIEFNEICKFCASILRIDAKHLCLFFLIYLTAKIFKNGISKFFFILNRNGIAFFFA